MESEQKLVYRRLLMQAAARGDAIAQQKLKDEYQVWIFSSTEEDKTAEGQVSPTQIGNPGAGSFVERTEV